MEADGEIENENTETNEIDNNEDESSPSPINVRRSTRISKPTDRHGIYVSHLQAINENNNLEYAPEECNILAMVMNQYKYSKKRLLDDKCSFLSTFTLRQGEKKFGIKAKDAAYKKMKQIDKRMVFEPIRIESLTEEEKKRAMESLIFLSEKRDGTIKSRYCANGSTQRSYIPKEQAASPTAGTDSVLITSVIEAKQGRDVMTLDIPNAFPQASIPDENEKVIMKIRGRLIDMLTGN